MLVVLDQIADAVQEARLSATKDADAASEMQGEIDDVTAFFTAMSSTRDFYDFQANGKQDGENDVGFIQDRVMEAGAADRDADEWRLVKLKRPYQDGARGEAVEMGKAEAEWFVRIGMAEWYEERDECPVPSVGDRLRIACLLSGA